MTMPVINLTLAKQSIELKSATPAGLYTETVCESADHPWDAAHQYLQKIETEWNVIKYLEPEIDMQLFEEEHQKFVIKGAAGGYLNNWPAPPQDGDFFVWHLGDDFSQLARARQKVWNGEGNPPKIKIAHIDTGYEPGHPALPAHLEPGISFVTAEEGGAAIDDWRFTPAEQQGHGTATMSLLAGNKLSLKDTGQRHEGYFGAIPFATIIPIRICETVALIRSKAFVKAVEYAIAQGCEVISMSMAGAPTREWADVVNKAYEKGIVMVTAAGNSWREGLQRLLPKRILYPARWDRVIAATGVTADHTPYVFDAARLQVKTAGGETMQGNYGPPEVMLHALAGYTPNTTWAILPKTVGQPYFSLDGGGTSSATPQIAAAAALWICLHRENLNALADTGQENQWKRVEAVKFALFNSASRDYPEWKKYLGQGALRAYDALALFPQDEQLTKAKPATVTWNGILDLLGVLIRLKGSNVERTREDMFATEILQNLHQDPNLHLLLNYSEEEIWSEEDKQKAKESLLRSSLISNSLRKKLSTTQSQNTDNMEIEENKEQPISQTIQNENSIEKQINIQQHTGDIIINYYKSKGEEKLVDETVRDIRSLVARGELKGAIEKMLEVSSVKYIWLFHDVIQLAGWYNSWEQNKMANLMSLQEASIELAKVRQSTLYLISKLG
jgi:hypothetical protein